MAPKTRQAPSAKTKLERKKKYLRSTTDKDFKKSFVQKVNDEAFASGNIARMLALPLEVIARRNIGLADAYIKYYKSKNKKKNGKKEK